MRETIAEVRRVLDGRNDLSTDAQLAYRRLLSEGESYSTLSTEMDELGRKFIEKFDQVVAAQEQLFSLQDEVIAHLASYFPDHA